MQSRIILFAILMSLSVLGTGCHCGSCRKSQDAAAPADSASMCSNGMCSHLSHAK